MRRSTLGLLAIILVAMACKGKEESRDPVMAEASEESEQIAENPEWTVLFDGSSLDAWKAFNGDAIPDAWSVEDGALVFTPPSERIEGQNYNIVTRQEFSNFILSLEWRISEGGNSGIFWGVAEGEQYGQPYVTGPEIQVLDNEKHPDAKAGTTHQAGALYDMVAPASDVTVPVGEWNKVEITVDYANQAGKVVLNGTEIVSFPLGNEAWDAMVAKSKFADWEGFGAFHTGKIGLQDHGDVVAYRNIKIKPLD